MWKNNRSLRFSTYHQHNSRPELSISYKQMAELKDEESTTLMSDETRKQGDVYEIRDQTGKNWVLGLKEMVNKSSQSCLDTLKSIINDIDTSSTTKFGQHILCNIKKYYV